MAKLPDGMVAQFRFYDPRVFGPFLSSCTPDELASWFDGVSAYLVERPGDRGLSRIHDCATAAVARRQWRPRNSDGGPIGYFTSGFDALA